MKIKYIGQKTDGETAFIAETQITWMPNAEHDIPAAVAERMLNHPDVFALADAKGKADVGLAAATTAPDATAADPGTETQWATAPDGKHLLLSDMTKEQLHACAKQFGVEVHPKCGAAKVIKALQTAFAVKE